MKQPTEKLLCKKSLRYYREYGGDRFWFWPSRNLYCSQKGGLQRFLHRELWEQRIGRKVRPQEEIVPVGSWEDFSDDNWMARERNSGRIQNVIHGVQIFNGMRFHKKPNGYWKLGFEQGGTYMHRYVWSYWNGKIPDGHHIHHKDGDKSNNMLENLELISASDHARLHSRSNKWIGSKGNVKQLASARKKSKAWHSSKEGIEWHSENAIKCGLGRSKC